MPSCQYRHGTDVARLRTRDSETRAGAPEEFEYTSIGHFRFHGFYLHDN